MSSDTTRNLNRIIDYITAKEVYFVYFPSNDVYWIDFGYDKDLSVFHTYCKGREPQDRDVVVYISEDNRNETETHEITIDEYNIIIAHMEDVFGKTISEITFGCFDYLT